MIRHFILCLTFFSLAEANIKLPCTLNAESFIIKSSLKFYIHDGEEMIGTMHRKAHSLSFEFVDLERNLVSVAVISKENPHLGQKCKIFDDEGGLIGFFEENPYSFLPHFNFYSPDGIPFASADSNFIHTEYLIQDLQTDQVQARLFRSAFRDNNDWSIDILEHSNIDPRILISFLAIRSDHTTKYDFNE